MDYVGPIGNHQRSFERYQSPTTYDQQERNAVTEKPHDAVVKFDTYQNLQRHRAVLPAIAWHLVLFCWSNFIQMTFNSIFQSWFVSFVIILQTDLNVT